MKKLVEQTSTQKLYWDEEKQIVIGECFAAIHGQEKAKENVDAQERVRERLGKEKTRVLIDMRLIKSISREARMYYANERTASIQRATALLIGSPVSRVIANFFMGLNRPLTPTKMFTGETEAIRWLRTFSDA